MTRDLSQLWFGLAFMRLAFKGLKTGSVCKNGIDFAIKRDLQKFTKQVFPPPKKKNINIINTESLTSKPLLMLSWKPPVHDNRISQCLQVSLLPCPSSASWNSGRLQHGSYWKMLSSTFNIWANHGECQPFLWLRPSKQDFHHAHVLDHSKTCPAQTSRTKICWTTAQAVLSKMLSGKAVDPTPQ